MQSTPEMVQLIYNGEWIGFRKTDLPLVRHWATKHNADTMSLVTSREDPSQVLIVDPVDVPPASLHQGTTYDLVTECWVAPFSNGDASNEASQIQRLWQSPTEYDEIRQTLAQAGYPDAVLDTMSGPKQTS